MDAVLIKSFVCVALAVFFSFYAYKNSANPTKAILAIVFVGFVLRLFTDLDPFLHDWDERFHALVAKNMMGHMLTPVLNQASPFGYDFTDWTNNHIWLHKPPLALWTMSLSLQVFGVNTFALRFPSLILSTLSIYLTYKIALQLYPQKPGLALLAAFLQAINGFVIEIASGRIPTDHVDTMLLFWIELGIWYAIQLAQQGFGYQKGAILGVLTAAAILCKWYVALLIPGMFGLYAILLDRNLLRTGIHTAFVTSIALVLSGIWSWYAYTHYPREFLWEQQFNARHFWEAIEDHSGAWWYFLDKARIQWNEGIYAIFLFFMYQTITKRNKSDLLILAWVLLPYLIFSASATKMNGYVLITAPAVFILIANFCQSVISYKNRTMLWQIVVGLILIFAIRYCIERVKPFQQNPIALQQPAQIKALESRLPNNAKTLIFNNKISIETMFYTNMISSRNLPSPNDFRIAKDHFNTIAVIKTPDLPDYLLKDSTLLIFELPE